MEHSYASLFKGMEQALGANQGVLQTFLETVGGTSAFEIFREIVHHNGPKEGGTLWGHVMNGLLVFHQLRTPLRISDEEQRILYMAYALHDINKYADDLLGLERLSFRKLATREHLIQAGQALAFERFVPDWKH